MAVVLGYVVCADAREAQRIGRALVEQKLVACANVVTGVESIFSWDATLQTAKEAVLFLKTLTEKMPAVEKQVKSLHSYDVPCICFYRAEHVNAEYEKWLRESLR